MSHEEKLVRSADERHLYSLEEVGVDRFEQWLTAAEVKSLRTAPLQLVEPPGPGTFWRILSLAAYLDAGSIPFSVVDGNFSVGYDVAHGVCSVGLVDFIDQATDQIAIGAGGFNYVYPRRVVENKPLLIFNDGSGDVTQGNGRVRVVITYQAFPLWSQG